MSGTVLLAVVGLFFPIISLIAAIYFFFGGELALGTFFFIWWLLWDE